jgi:hypothetical protein
MKYNPTIFFFSFRFIILLVVLIGLFGCSLGFEWHDVAPSDFLNGWDNVGGAFETAGYGQDDMGFVHLKGWVNDSSYAAYSYMFVLPPGDRPNNTLVFSVYIGSGQNGYVYIYYDGGVALYAPGASGNVSVPLNGIIFYAEQ